MAKNAIQKYSISLRLASRCFGISTSQIYYKYKNKPENEIIADWLIRLTTTYKKWGFGSCFLHLRHQKGFTWNHKRVYRIYRELELNLRIKPRRRLKRVKPEALVVPAKINDTWSMDFMSDSLADGRTIRTFNIIDDYNREGLCIDVDLSMPSSRVIRSIEQVIEWRGKPKNIRCDNGPEYISISLVEWAKVNEINLIYIQPGKPTQNAYVERYNRTVRNEWLDLNVFDSVDHAQTLATEWLWLYNNERPHMALNGLTPIQFLNQ